MSSEYEALPKIDVEILNFVWQMKKKKGNARANATWEKFGIERFKNIAVVVPVIFPFQLEMFIFLVKHVQILWRGADKYRDYFTIVKFIRVL